MILIAHRGNINGRNEDVENHPEYIIQSLDKGYDCEIDVWNFKDKWYLGHDTYTYYIPISFLNKYGKHLWIHAKNINALYELTKTKLNYFWNDNDIFTLTSKKYIWSLSIEKLTDRSICVMPEKTNQIPQNCLGICSDFIERYKNLY